MSAYYDSINIRQATDWAKYSKNMYLSKGLYLEYGKMLLQFNDMKTYSPFTNKQRLKKILQNWRYTDGQKVCEKVDKIINYQGSAN